MIIMGTSLKVHGLKKLVKDFARTIHENASKVTTLTSRPKPKVIFVNKTAPGSEWANVIDYHVTGETDAWVAKVIEDWKQIKSEDWEAQLTLDGNSGLSSPFRAMKLGAEAAKTKKGGLITPRSQDILSNASPRQQEAATSARREH
jgi:NAD-dependent histone deacetylase SIR2